ncbi:MAG: STAS domain-containing protein [Chromatiales bacterium]|nr:STAS domain-containing protein [Chromatiales bacterium]
MAVTSQCSSDGQELTIRVQGRFDFSTHREFRDAIQNCPRKPQRYVVDLRSTEYMDSSALGMLLLLREEAGGDSQAVSLRNANPEIRQVLTISNFQKMFVLD